MIRERLFCIFVLLSVLLTANADSRQHVVKPGDTLYSLSKRYGVTVEDIQAANPSIEGTNIPAGMTLVIPDENEVSKKKDKKRSIFFNFKKRDKNKDKVAEEMVEQLIELRCDYLQGFYFARPMKEEDFVEFMSNN